LVCINIYTLYIFAYLFIYLFIHFIIDPKRREVIGKCNILPCLMELSITSKIPLICTFSWLIIITLAHGGTDSDKRCEETIRALSSLSKVCLYIYIYIYIMKFKLLLLFTFIARRYSFYSSSKLLTISCETRSKEINLLF
jgi:hypothetical protein